MKTLSILISLSTAVASVACDVEREPEQAGNQHPAADEEREVAANQPNDTLREPGDMPREQTVREQAAAGDDLAPEEQREEAQDAAELIDEAATALNQMKSNAKLASLLKQAKGVFIVPDYGRAAVGVGVRGGEGVLLVRQAGGDWSPPVFYDLGGISIGAQLGGEGGDIAMILMSDQAIQTFKGDDTFTINADAKLTLVDYSALSEAAMGQGKDIVFWSGTEGVFAGVALGVTDIDWDDEENPAYHGRAVSAKDLIEGKVTTAGPKRGLEQALTGL